MFGTCRAIVGPKWGFGVHPTTMWGQALSRGTNPHFRRPKWPMLVGPPPHSHPMRGLEMGGVEELAKSTPGPRKVQTSILGPPTTAQCGDLVAVFGSLEWSCWESPPVKRKHLTVQQSEAVHPGVRRSRPGNKPKLQTRGCACYLGARVWAAFWSLPQASGAATSAPCVAQVIRTPRQSQHLFLLGGWASPCEAALSRSCEDCARPSSCESESCRRCASNRNEGTKISMSSRLKMCA